MRVHFVTYNVKMQEQAATDEDAFHKKNSMSKRDKTETNCLSLMLLTVDILYAFSYKQSADFLHCSDTVGWTTGRTSGL